MALRDAVLRIAIPVALSRCSSGSPSVTETSVLVALSDLEAANQSMGSIVHPVPRRVITLERDAGEMDSQ